MNRSKYISSPKREPYFEIAKGQQWYFKGDKYRIIKIGDDLEPTPEGHRKWEISIIKEADSFIIEPNLLGSYARIR